MSVLLDEYVDRCLDLFELEHADCYKNAIDIEALVKEDVLPDLENIKWRLGVANTAALLEMTGRTPQKLKKRSFRRFRKLVRGVPDSTLSDYYQKTDAAIARALRVGPHISCVRKPYCRLRCSNCGLRVPFINRKASGRRPNDTIADLSIFMAGGSFLPIQRQREGQGRVRTSHLTRTAKLLDYT